VLSAVAQAARNGVLVKGGIHLENLGRIRAVAFDKTGTLTSGRPEITDVVPLDGANTEELLRVAASAERRSAHPLALAVLDLAAQRGIEPSPADQVTAVAGIGLRASVNGQSVEIGNLSLFAEGPGQIPPELVRQSERLEQEGKSVILVRRNGAFLGLLGAADQPRPSAAAALAALKAQGVEALVMLTGDNDRVAAAIAGRVGLSEYRASLLPEDKVAALDQLAAQYGGVAMVGDGINDAPALAHSTVGIAMGAGGSQLALETADVALMADDLSKLPFALSLSRQARRIIRQNLAISVGVIALLVPAALFGLAGIGPAILLHEGSTLLVVANALRLLSHRTS
jgi:Cd2+/Zn2+-exporting ATPase